MPSVFLCSPYNSTMFTTCCGCAILDHQDRCPRCRQEIEPKGDRARWGVAYRERRYVGTVPSHAPRKEPHHG